MMSILTFQMSFSLEPRPLTELQKAAPQPPYPRPSQQLLQVNPRRPVDTPFSIVPAKASIRRKSETPS